MHLVAFLAAAASVTANLDSDAHRERVASVEVRDEFDYVQHRIVLEDDCRNFALSRAYDQVARLRAAEIDDVTARREVHFELRSGAAGRAGLTRVVRLDRAPDGCSRPRVLWTYSSTRPVPGPPRGYYVANYGATVRRGRIRLHEYLARNDQPPIAARRERISTWRYDRARGRFTRRSVRTRAA